MLHNTPTHSSKDQAQRPSRPISASASQSKVAMFDPYPFWGSKLCQHRLGPGGRRSNRFFRGCAAFAWARAVSAQAGWRSACARRSGHPEARRTAGWGAGAR